MAGAGYAAGGRPAVDGYINPDQPAVDGYGNGGQSQPPPPADVPGGGDNIPVYGATQSAIENAEAGNYGRAH